MLRGATPIVAEAMLVSAAIVLLVVAIDIIRPYLQEPESIYISSGQAVIYGKHIFVTLYIVKRVDEDVRSISIYIAYRYKGSSYEHQASLLNQPQPGAQMLSIKAYASSQQDPGYPERVVVYVRYVLSSGREGVASATIPASRV